jgi:DNA-binding response OmpR family regulator
MIKVLLYSDDNRTKNRINKILDSKEFNFLFASNPESLTSALNNDIKLIIIDSASLKDKDQTDVINILKSTGHMDGIVKIVLLKPDRGFALFEDEIQFDDFCFSSRIEEELLLRTRAVLSRMHIYPPKNSIIVGDLILDLDRYRLSVKDIAIELTFKEFELLKLLLENQNKVFTRDKLLSIIWDYDFYGGSRTIDVHIRRLRSKIPPPYNLMLKTIRNVGYMFSSQI